MADLQVLTWSANPLMQMAYRCRPLTASARTYRPWPAPLLQPALVAASFRSGCFLVLLQLNQQLEEAVIQLEQKKSCWSRKASSWKRR